MNEMLHINNVEGDVKGELTDGRKVEIRFGKNAENSEVWISGENVSGSVTNVKIWADPESLFNTCTGYLKMVPSPEYRFKTAQDIIDEVEEEMTNG